MKRDIIIIILIVLSTLSALEDVARISNRRAQQQRVRTVRKPQRREMRL